MNIIELPQEIKNYLANVKANIDALNKQRMMLEASALNTVQAFALGKGITNYKVTPDFNLEINDQLQEKDTDTTKQSAE